MPSFLQRLTDATRWGALLAAASCGGQATSEPAASGGSSAGGSGAVGGSAGSGATGGGGVSGTGASGGGPTDASTDDAAPPPIPYPTPAGCSGPVYDGGYWGQCCEVAGCIAPVNGACPAASTGAEYLGGPFGSGACTCGAEPKGPFAPRDPVTEKECCYLYSSIGCDGRPLIVAGVARLAPLVLRSDWGWGADDRSARELA